MSAEAYRYATTHTADAHDRGIEVALRAAATLAADRCASDDAQAFKALKFLIDVAYPPGFVARAIVKVSASRRVAVFARFDLFFFLSVRFFRWALVAFGLLRLFDLRDAIEAPSVGESRRRHQSQSFSEWIFKADTSSDEVSAQASKRWRLTPSIVRADDRALGNVSARV